MGWTTFGKIEPPVGAWRDRLQAATARARGDDRHSGFRVAVCIGQTGRTVGIETHDVRTKRRGPLGHGDAARPTEGRWGDKYTSGYPRARHDRHVGRERGFASASGAAPWNGHAMRYSGKPIPASNGKDASASFRRLARRCDGGGAALWAACACLSRNNSSSSRSIVVQIGSSPWRSCMIRRCAAKVTFNVPRVVSGRGMRICTRTFSISSTGLPIAIAMSSADRPDRRIPRASDASLAVSSRTGRSSSVRFEISPAPLPGGLPLKAIRTDSCTFGFVRSVYHVRATGSPEIFLELRPRKTPDIANDFADWWVSGFADWWVSGFADWWVSYFADWWASCFADWRVSFGSWPACRRITSL